jgi:vancomycin resistance protein YoaR
MAKKRTDANRPVKAKATKPAKEKKPSALDAAAKVLAEANEPMTTPALIEAMAAKKYWTSPNGQTPAATLYAAICREIGKKGKDARFKKTGRGTFALA